MINVGTEVPVLRSVGEIQSMLVQARAEAIMVEYDAGQPASIAFRLTKNETPLHFRLPCNWRNVQAAMKKDLKISHRVKNDVAQIQRVAWRILRESVRVQLTMIECGNAELEQVMLGYLVNPADNKTLYETMRDQGFKALPAPK